MGKPGKWTNGRAVSEMGLQHWNSSLFDLIIPRPDHQSKDWYQRYSSDFETWDRFFSRTFPGPKTRKSNKSGTSRMKFFYLFQRRFLSCPFFCGTVRRHTEDNPHRETEKRKESQEEIQLHSILPDQWLHRRYIYHIYRSSWHGLTPYIEVTTLLQLCRTSIAVR